jgi:hypothetical protein
LIRPQPLPDAALLQAYARDGGYTDCYATDLPRAVSHAQYVEAFYTTWLFRLERWILGWAVSRPSTGAQARELAAGSRDAFAAWSVERRAPDQLLLCDMFGRTRSWLMTAPLPAGGTRLYFGSGVAPRRDGRLGRTFSLLLGFHKLYSIALLGAARRRLERLTKASPNNISSS